jgi:D-alanine-D-alanine ligase
VLLGDPRLPDPTKPSGRFAPEDFESIARLKAALATLPQYTVTYLDDHATLLDTLRTHPPAFVLNLCDTGYRNVPTWELHVAALLELLGIPYSGATPATLVTCYDKGLIVATARGLGIPVPEERYFETARAALDALAAPEALAGALPALIKPNHGDGSVGITQRAVVRTPAEARNYLAWLAEALPGRAVLVQEYLPGPEYGVGLIGNPASDLEVLPVLEVDFSALPAGCAPILCYESKAMPESPWWSDLRFPAARLDAPTHARVVADSRRLFARLGLRDYARMDFRTDAAGTVKLMEVNPNPAWAYDGKLALMAGVAGRSYAELLERLIRTALVRIGSAA